MNFKVGEEIVIIQNMFGGFYDFLIGKLGTITEDYDNGFFLVDFGYDDPRFNGEYICAEAEMRHK